MLNGYTGTLVLALHLLPVVLLWATWKLPQEAAGSKIVLGQTLGSGVFLLLFPMAEQLHWGWGLSALRLDLSLLGGPCTSSPPERWPWGQRSFGEDGTKHNEKEARLRAVPPFLCSVCPALRLQQQRQ